MKNLELHQMEQINGGWSWGCILAATVATIAGGIAGGPVGAAVAGGNAILGGCYET